MRETLNAQADTRTNDALARHGVTDPEIIGHCGLTRVERQGGFYEPTEHGVLAIIVPILDGDELCDLLAFDPRQPEKWWLRYGSSHFLGGDNIFCWSAPISVWRTPLPDTFSEWIRRTPSRLSTSDDGEAVDAA